MTDIEKLTKYANQHTFLASEKDDLAVVLERHGVETPKRGCDSCWRDAAIMALREARKSEPKDNELPVLRGDAGNVGVIWRGRLVNNDTMTAELAQWLIETGFPESLYEKK